MSTSPLIDLELERELGGFIRWEAQLLDDGCYEEWNALFAPEGMYWMPVSPCATDPRLEASHLYDDRILREIHLARLRSAHAHSQQPAGRCHHQLQTSDVVEFDANQGRARTRTAFVYYELRSGRTITLPGVAWHSLIRDSGNWKIILKRVDLMHASEPLPAVEFYV